MSVWRSLPLYLLVYEELRRLVHTRGVNTIRDTELYEKVREAAKMRGFELDYSDFLKSLMILEMQGYIYVYSTSDKSDRGKIIELLRDVG